MAKWTEADMPDQSARTVVVTGANSGIGLAAARAFAVNDAGRGVRLPDVPAAPTVLLRMEREALIRLAGGRCEPDPGTVEVVGEEELGRRILDTMATTP